MYSPEMETLDQLLGGDMPLTVIRGIYPDEASFLRGVLALLSSGDVRLLTQDNSETPPWRWRELFEEGRVIHDLKEFRLTVSPRGAQRVT